MMIARQVAISSRRSFLTFTSGLIVSGLCEKTGLASGNEPVRLLVIGDSQAQGVAGALQRIYRWERRKYIIDRSRIATGLAGWSALDWPKAARMFVASDRADITIAMFGANDRPPVRVGGRVDHDALETFRRTYGAKVIAVAEAMQQSHIAAVWVGHPIVRDPDYADDIQVLNQIYSAAAVGQGLEWLPTWETFRRPDEGYTAYGPGTDGERTRLRADDGVHMTPAGYDVIARMLGTLIDQLLNPASAEGRTASTTRN
jgi:hypothetical protein